MTVDWLYCRSLSVMARLVKVVGLVTRTLLSLLLPAYLSLSALTQATSNSQTWSESFRTESSHVKFTGERGGELVYKHRKIILSFRIPSYRSDSSGEENPLDWWLRYWVVVSCAAIPDIILTALQVIPHHETVRTVFICWCLTPGPFSGTQLIFNQVLPLTSGPYKTDKSVQIFPIFSMFHETGLAVINQSVSVSRL